MLWQIAHGETPDNIRNHPLLKGLTIPRTGRQGRIGTLVTKTLVIAGEGGTFTMPDGRRGAMLRAYNKGTGQEVGAVFMPASQTGSPMTYSLNGQQYIVVAISGPGFPGELIAFKLPKAVGRRREGGRRVGQRSAKASAVRDVRVHESCFVRRCHGPGAGPSGRPAGP